jgi:Ser/Thr protein kinase RdoA (MazF antagonist)
VENILRRFPIGRVTEVRRASSGLMHGTWLVEAEGGKFVLQRLHHKLATPEILSDFKAVTEHLAARGVLAPRLVATETGEGVAEDDGRWWRLATYVEGETHDAVQSPEQAEEGARALARFHRAMQDIDHHFQSQHPLHDTEGHLRRLREAAARPEFAEVKAGIADEIAEADAQLSRMLLPPELPRRVVHGDPKISNVLFQGDRAVGLLDLDTCTRHTVLVDLGDAVRSWCRDGTEDERHHFKVDRFEAILRGYAAEGPPLGALERRHLGEAGRLITLELASRFLRDVLEDEYFAWDERRFPDRRTHNRARGRAMLYLANDMARWQPEIDAMVVKYFGAMDA